METEITKQNIDNNVGYIYCRAKGGFNDALNQLYDCTLYAIKYNCHIILELSTYNSLEISKIFNFSNYPVIIHSTSKLKEITISNTEPSFYYPFIFLDTNNIFNFQIKFNKNEIYSKNTLLIHDSYGGGQYGINVLQKIKLTSYFINLFNEKYNKLPLNYNAIHFRYSDNVLYYEYNKIYPNTVKLAINSFIKSSPYIVYIASDNKEFLNYIKNKFNKF